MDYENRDVKKEKHLKIALAGNPNVGKSVIFNQLTGLSQIVGNWPGKTVAKAEGKARFDQFIFNIVDLPGIYSLSTYSLEEIISRQFIIEEKPDFIINVIDVNHLERNLFFTLQLLMLNRPMVISLNQYDLLKRRGYEIDVKQLELLLGVPCVATTAVHNRGVHELLEKVINFYHQDYQPKKFPLGKEIEAYLAEFTKKLQKYFPNRDFPLRFASLKLLENDESIIEDIKQSNGELDKIIAEISETREKLEETHGHQVSTIINSDMFNIANGIRNKVEFLKKQTKKQFWNEKIDHFTVHSVIGYFILFGILFGSYFLIFSFGDWISGVLDIWAENLDPFAINLLGGADNWVYKILWRGLFAGFIGGVGGVLPYVIPFFLLIEVLQDVGYLPRAAYLMDHFLHKIGVHGKTIIPILLGFGCNVPAVTAASIMETEKEKRRSIIISSMIPCSAVATIIMGLVGSSIGFEYAFLLYMVNFGAIIFVGKVLTSMDVTSESELIIELHDFRVPNFKVIAKQTWNRSREFVFLALPLIVIMGGLLEVFLAFNILEPINIILSPIIVSFLGLPIGIGVFLIYGIIRKELNLVLLELFVISLGLTMIEYLSPIQMITFSLITMLYIPCVATIIVVKKEAGTKFALQISVMQIGLALLIAGLIRWIYEFFKWVANFPPFTSIILSILVFFILLGGYAYFLGKKKDKAKIAGGIDSLKPNVIKGSDCYGTNCGNSNLCNGCKFRNN